MVRLILRWLRSLLTPSPLPCGVDGDNESVLTMHDELAGVIGRLERLENAMLGRSKAANTRQSFAVGEEKHGQGRSARALQTSVNAAVADLRKRLRTASVELNDTAATCELLVSGLDWELLGRQQDSIKRPPTLSPQSPAPRSPTSSLRSLARRSPTPPHSPAICDVGSQPLWDDIDGSQPLWNDIDGSQPLWDDVDGSQPIEPSQSQRY